MFSFDCWIVSLPVEKRWCKLHFPPCESFHLRGLLLVRETKKDPNGMACFHVTSIVPHGGVADLFEWIVVGIWR